MTNQHETDRIVIVNAREHTVHTDELSFVGVVMLAFPTPPPGQQIEYTITYRKSAEHPHDGTLTDGNTVRIKNHGTIFNVTATDKS